MTLDLAEPVRDAVLRLSGQAAGARTDAAVHVAAQVERINGAWRVSVVGFGLETDQDLSDRLGLPPDWSFADVCLHTTIPNPVPFAAPLPADPGAGADWDIDADPETDAKMWSGQADRAEASRRRRPVGPLVGAVGAITLAPGGDVEIPPAPERFTARLLWDVRTKDLDLYALYIDARGRPGVCYYRRPGSLKKQPYISLVSADTRGADEIEIAHPDTLRYVLLCAYSAFENGIGAFHDFGARVQIDDHSGSVVTVPLYHRDKYSYWVAITLIDLSRPGRTVVSQVERYSSRRSERRPVLRRDGTFVMDRGPIEFKRS